MDDIPMKILLVEDDINECKIYKKIIEKRKDVKLIEATNSSIKAIEICKRYKPEGIILDLELSDGEGSGFDFIEKINKLDINKIPKIIVTTNVHSDSVYDFCHKSNIDFIFYKKQKNYSQENIINTLLLIRGYNNTEKINNMEINEKEKEEEIKEKINKELECVGISSHLQGKQYLSEAILFIIQNGENCKTPIVQHLVKIYKKPNSSISRAMQNAIIHGWRVTPIEELMQYYTARVNYETGVPTPTELIYYYVDKIKKEI